MKRILTLFLTCIFLSITITVSAQNDFCLNIPQVKAQRGEVVEMDITLENNSGILAMLYELTYDQSRLKLVGAEDKGLVDGAVFSPKYDNVPYVMVWNSASRNNFTQDGVLATLKFEVLENAPSGTAFVKIEYDQENVFDVDLVDVPILIVNGGVEVEGKEGSTTTTVVPRPSSGRPHSGISVPVKVEDLTKQQVILTIGEKKALVFGVEKENDVAPKIVQDRTMLPARFVAESLGAQVIWTADEPKKVIIKTDTTEIVMYIDSDVAYVNNNEVRLDSPAFLENDRTYTPVRFIAEALGASVSWDEPTQRVTITKNKK